MRCYKLTLILLGVVALVAAPTFASTVLFQDDFETGTVGNLPSGGAPGSWAFAGDVTHNQVVNTGAPTAPASGSNYLQIVRTDQSAAGYGDSRPELVGPLGGRPTARSVPGAGRR